MINFNKIAKMGTIIAAIVIGIGFSVFFLQYGVQLEAYDGIPKALIIDQLYDEMPNEHFHILATEYLETAGYAVDIVTTQNVTVDFYKELPKMNYKYVVVRTHGAENVDDVVLFTGERYSEEEYIQEQLFGQVKKAAPLRETSYKVDSSSSDWEIINSTTKILRTPANPVYETKDEFFAISPDLVKHGMNGKFDDTVFVLGGCNTLSNPSLAESLSERGASMVLGWDDTVGNYDNDFTLLYILEQTLVNNLEIDEALSELIYNTNPDRMAYPAQFISHPAN